MTNDLPLPLFPFPFLLLVGFLTVLVLFLITTGLQLAWMEGLEFQDEGAISHLAWLEGSGFQGVGLLVHLARMEGSTLQSAGPCLVAALIQRGGASPALEEICIEQLKYINHCNLICPYFKKILFFNYEL